jgi:tetratricopeptide (TPR) repeat protein
LAGAAAGEARRAIVELAGASLAAEHRPGRYVLHDLVRGYAAGHARQALGEDGIRAAIGRSLDHYLQTMVAFSSDIPWVFTPAPPAPGVVPEQLAGETGLEEWARAEHQVLLQATAQAAAAGFLTRAWQLFACQASFLGGQEYWADFRATGQAVLAAAQAADDQAALGWTHAIIGLYGMFTDTQDEDSAHLHGALEHFQRAGDLTGQAWAYLFAARPAARNGDWAQAVKHCEQALELFRPAGNTAAERWALPALGECHAHLGNYDLAHRYARQALELSPEADDPTSLARAWDVLGLVHSRAGEHPEAISCYRHALALAHQQETPRARWWLAGLLVNFGSACRAAGDLPAAAGAWLQALQILEDLGLPDDRRIRAKLQQASAPTPPRPPA